jgi:hypothetical protein
MKHFALCLIVVLLFCTPSAHAGLIKHWGLFGGLTSSNHAFDGDNFIDDSQKRRTGINGGAFVEWLNIPLISIKSQSWYNEKGAGIEFLETSYEYPLGNGTVTENTRLSYISFAILGKLQMSSGLFPPYLEAGPRFDYLLAYEENRVLTEVYKNFEKSIYGLTFGAGLERSLPGGPTLLLEIRYNIDLKDSYSVDTEAFNYSMRNRSFEVSAGLGF